MIQPIGALLHGSDYGRANPTHGIFYATRWNSGRHRYLNLNANVSRSMMLFLRGFQANDFTPHTGGAY